MCVLLHLLQQWCVGGQCCQTLQHCAVCMSVPSHGQQEGSGRLCSCLSLCSARCLCSTVFSCQLLHGKQGFDSRGDCLCAALQVRLVATQGWSNPDCRCAARAAALLFQVNLSRCTRFVDVRVRSKPETSPASVACATSSPPVGQHIHQHIDGNGVLRKEGAARDVLCMARKPTLADHRQHVVHDAIKHLQQETAATRKPSTIEQQRAASHIRLVASQTATSQHKLVASAPAPESQRLPSAWVSAGRCTQQPVQM